MNQINVRRLLIAGVITLLVFIAIEIIVESIIGRVLFRGVVEHYYGELIIPYWGTANNILNIFIALVNCFILMWLYAALRPMFGVGVKTALIASAFMLTFIIFYSINLSNLRIIPWRITLVESIYQVVELPLALMIGAYFYEMG
jgi:hypothetical protein